METTGIDLESRFTYFKPFPRLEDMACLAVALETWDYYYSLGNRKEVTYEYDHELIEVNKIVDVMKEPNIIKEKIKTLFITMKESMADYYSTHELREMCNCDDYDEDKSTHFFPYRAVWDTSGRIDLRKTAKKVISCPRRLNDNDLMFTIISKYSLENHIRDFPISSLSDQFVRDVEENSCYCSNHRSTYYWMEFKKRSISNCNPSSYHDTQQNILSFLARFDFYYTKTPVYEYFWNFLDENSQAKLAWWLTEENAYGVMNQRILFSKMSSCQLRQLYSEKPVDIIMNFFCLGELELAKAAWERVKSKIEGEKFERLMKRVLENAKVPCKRSCLQFAIHLWNSAPEYLIQYMVNERNCEIIAKFLKGKPIYGSSCVCEFLKIVLSRATFEFRRKLLLNKGSYIIINYSHTIFSSLIQNFLNETDQIEIKEKILIEALNESKPARIIHHFRDTLYWGREYFYEFLTFFTTKESLQTRVKIHLLRSGLLVVTSLWKADDWNNLCQFIDEFYHSNQEVAHQEKKKIVLSFVRSCCSFWGCYRPNGDEKFVEIDNLITQVLTPEQIITTKEEIIDHFLKYIKKPRHRPSRYLKRMNVQRFVSWGYCGDEEKIERFRRSFPIDRMFYLVLREIVIRHANKKDADLSFSSLEELLRWKFSTKKKIGSFKRCQIHNAMRIKLIETSTYMITRRSRYLGIILKKILEWVFDEEKSKIKEFKQLYKNEDETKIIHWLKIWEDMRDWLRYYEYHVSDDMSDETSMDESE